MCADLGIMQHCIIPLILNFFMTELTVLEGRGSSGDDPIRQIPRINHDAFEIAEHGRLVGRGTWGEVYEGRCKVTGDKVAIKILPDEKHLSPVAKEQLLHRRMTLDDTHRNDSSGRLEPYVNVLRAFPGIDRDGVRFLVMPLCECNLEEKLRYESVSPAEKLKLALDISHGLSEWHSKTRKAHRDIKPKNVLLSDDRALLSDMGITSLLISDRPRDRIGDVITRAPEGFLDGNNQDMRSDIYSLGATLTYLFSGATPHQDPKALKRVPRRVRKVLKKCLEVNPKDRYHDAVEVHSALKKAVDDTSSIRKFWAHIKKWGLSVGLPLIIFGAFAYLSDIYEPQKLGMPETHVSSSSLEEISSDERIVFDAENIPSESESVSASGVSSGSPFWDIKDIEYYAKHSTNNRVVAYLIKTYALANGVINGECERGEPENIMSATPNQLEVSANYHALNNPGFPNHEFPGFPWNHWGRSIESALGDSRTSGGRVDLEDVMAISRIGVGGVNEAKNKARSTDYEVYRDYLPKAERIFIDTWLGFYHEGIEGK